MCKIAKKKRGGRREIAVYETFLEETLTNI